jgi:hypothetical protein
MAKENPFLDRRKPVAKETPFLDSVNHMVDRAFGTMELPPGLPDEIKHTNSVYRGAQ